MNIGLFLGAGASVPYGFKTTNTIKQEIVEATRNTELFNFVYNILHDDHYPDIEYLLDVCNKIIELNKNEHVATALNYISYYYEDRKYSHEHFINSIENLKNKLYKLVFSAYKWTDNSELLDANYGVIYDKIKSLDSNVKLYVFTTNYDQAVEKYYATHDINYYDGFLNKNNIPYKIYDGNFDNNTNVENYLCKLHGSLNWKKDKQNNEIQAQGPEQQLDNYHDVMIEPTLSPKNEECKEPFRTYGKQFEKFMKNNKCCIVIGFSFRDYQKIFMDFIKNDGILIIISKNGITNFLENCIKKNIDNYDQLVSGPIFNEVFLEHRIYDKSNNSHGTFATYDEHITLENIDEIMGSIIEYIKLHFIK